MGKLPETRPYSAPNLGGRVGQATAEMLQIRKLASF